MKTEDLKKKLQGIDNGRVRGRLKGNFGYMRSDEIARVQEIKKKTKTALGYLFDENQQRGNERVCYSPDSDSEVFQVQISNCTPRRQQDPEVIIFEKTEMKVPRKEMEKRTSEVEMDFEDSDEERTDEDESKDVLVV